MVSKSRRTAWSGGHGCGEQLEAPDVASLLPWAKLAKRSKSRLNRSEYNRAETVEETAELVTRSAAPVLRHCVTSKLRAATVALWMRGWRERKKHLHRCEVLSTEDDV